MSLSKQLGTAAELIFAGRAVARGFTVMAPFTDSRDYDLVLERDGKFHRVQVKARNIGSIKSTGNGAGDVYMQRHTFLLMQSVGRSRVRQKAYDKDSLDFFALYIVEHDKFLIIPSNIAPVQVKINYNQKDSKWMKYLEKWEVIK